ncbi:MAG: patatin-like phospholipase family protein [Actinobacteria bacterium]|nr:patatin-like phospholipase family protein [Actinomycetota bacterium]
MFGKRKIGIALSGGAARGLSHIGVLQVLEDIGVEISAVSGCSMGAVIGAIYCTDFDLKEMESFVTSTDWRNFMMFSLFSLSRTGIVNERKVGEVLKKFLGDKTFADCKKDFCCVAVDILNNKKIVFNSGSLTEAVRASIAVPGVFPPVYLPDAMLVDGGVLEPLPTDALKSLDVNFIIASSIVFESAKSDNKYYDTKSGIHKNFESKKLSIQAILDKSMCMMHTQIVKSYLQNAHIVIEPKIGDFGFFDFSKGKEIIESGRKAAIEKIPEIKRKLRLR